MKKHIERFNDWFNDQSDQKQAICYAGFCLAFIVLLWLSIRYIHFDAKIYTNPVPQHIGKTIDPLTPKK